MRYEIKIDLYENDMSDVYTEVVIAYANNKQAAANKVINVYKDKLSYIYSIEETYC